MDAKKNYEEFSEIIKLKYYLTWFYKEYIWKKLEGTKDKRSYNIFVPVKKQNP